MYQSIVTGTDGSPSARVAVRTATYLATLCGAKLHVVCGYRLPSEMLLVGPMGTALAPAASDEEVRTEVEGMLRSLASEIAEKGVAVTTHARAGNAAVAILDVAERERADLIVVGNRGMQGQRPLLGSVPNNVLHHAGCAVLVEHTSTGAEQGLTI